MSSRDAILARLRAAAVPPPESETLITPRDIDLYHDHPGKVNACYVQTFVDRLTALKGECRRVPDMAAAGDAVLELLQGAAPATVMAQDAPLLREAFAGHSLSDSCQWAADPLPDNVALAQLTAGITVADYLVARTGSIMLRSTSAAGRRLSVVPPLHIVVAREDQVVASLWDGLDHFADAAGEPWSYGVVISGPSRTADIEKILVLGAHGPKRLAVILLPAAGPLEISVESKSAKDKDGI